LSLHAWRYFARKIFWTSTKVGQWSSTCLWSFYLDGPSLVNTNIYFRVLPLLLVSILSKTEARVVVTPRQSQTKALRGGGWLCFFFFLHFFHT
jgi:hypothetical protein